MQPCGTPQNVRNIPSFFGDVCIPFQSTPPGRAKLWDYLPFCVVLITASSLTLLLEGNLYLIISCCTLMFVLVMPLANACILKITFWTHLLIQGFFFFIYVVE
jgi:hypothetical protein